MPRAVPVPADLDVPDAVLWGANGRQVALLAPACLVALLAWYRLAGDVDPRLLLVITAPPLAAVAALAFGRVDGLDLDRLALAALRRPRGPLAPGRPDPGAARVAASRAPVPRPVRGPVHALSEEGLLDLGPAGVACAVDVGCVNFSLRSADEQEQLVAAFAGLLGAVEAHVQVLVATRPVDLTGYLAESARTARELADPALSQAAADHTVWLAELMRGQRLLERQVTVAVRCADAELCERAVEAVTAFAESIGVAARRLDGAGVAERVRAGIDPWGTPVRRAS
ncbi:PrgI family protein [Glycomyces sp. MUSA5-2]|uniref:PrgI family protein n=1 Tax=Glycomyces sp. MUSA5-2 TaxID=2053002 RepID=UPI0030084D3D